MVDIAAPPFPSEPSRPVGTFEGRAVGADGVRFNWLGVWTLYIKEVRRFLNVIVQTILAPCVTSLLMIAVFSLALGRVRQFAPGITYLQFLSPGLIIMTMVQNAFANSSSSLMVSKMQGNIVDLLMAPLSAAGLLTAYAAGAVTRGLIVGIALAVVLLPVTGFTIAHPLSVLYFGLSGSLMLALIGIAGGIWADKIEHLAAITNFVVTPLTFLSGTFYAIDRLPPLWRHLSDYDPFFYVIDGFRYGFIGVASGSLWIGVVFLGLLNALMMYLSYRLLASGYKLKA